MTIPDPDDVAQDMVLALERWNETTERGQQKQEHRIGISDIGTCREYVRRMTIEEAFSDDPNKFTAFVGSAFDRLAVEAVSLMFPNVLTHVSMSVRLPSGATYTGHPDLVHQDGVLDVKTVDGLTAVKRRGPDLQQQFQRHLYYAGLNQQGRLPDDGWVGNVWWDRSGRQPTPHVQLESYDPTWLHHADEWLSDVIYAVKTGEEAPKDPPLDWCQKCCEFFTNCRGEQVLTDREGGGLIEDPGLVDMVDAYVEAKAMAKEAEHIIEDARRALADTSGRTGTHMVKWIHVNESEVPGFTRSGYSRLDIRKIPLPTRKG